VNVNVSSTETVSLVDHDHVPEGWYTETNRPDYDRDMGDPDYSPLVWGYPRWPDDDHGYRENGVRLYGTRYTAYDENTAWQGRIETHQEKIEIPILEQLEGEEAEFDPSDLIQPVNSSDSELLKSAKFAGKAKLRIIDGQSVDEDGIVISSGPLSYSSLASKRIITKQNNWFYSPPAGQMSNTYRIDAHLLTTDSDLNSLGIDSIYVGSQDPINGRTQFPAPGCPDGHIINDVFKVNVSENGWVSSHCNADDAANIGTIETVMIENAQELGKDFAVASNLTVGLRGDTNAVNPKLFAVYSDSTSFYSNSFEPDNWSQYNVIGPNNAIDTTYNLAMMTGKVLPLVEHWKDGSGNSTNLNQFGSEAIVWKSPLMNHIRRGLKSDGTWRKEYYNSFNRMFVTDPDCEHGDHDPCYHYPNWNLTQDERYKASSPPLSLTGGGVQIAILTLRDIDKDSDYTQDSFIAQP